MKLKRVFKSKIFIALFISIFGFLFFLLFNGFKIVYATNDDFFISLFLVNGEEKNIFINFFLSYPIVALQKIFPYINIYMLFQLLICAASIIVINYVFLDKFNGKNGLVLSIIFTLMFSINAVVSLQWTQTTVISCVAGLLLLLHSTLYIHGRKKIFQIIYAVSLVIFSSFFRFISVKVIFGLFAVFILTQILIVFLRNKEHSASKLLRIKSAFLKFWKPVLIVFLLWTTVLSLNTVSNNIKKSSTEYVAFSRYNSVRAGSVDYYRPPYDENKEFYNTLDIYSQNDLDILGTWHGDEDFFTTERLAAISKYVKQPQFQSLFSFNYLYRIISNKIENITGISALPILIGLGILIICLIAVLFCFRNKIKLIFPFIIACIWFGFFYVFKISDVNVLAIPLALIIVISSFVYNRYSYFTNLVLTLCFFALYSYLNFSRISFRTTYNMILPVFVLVVYGLNNEQIRSEIKRIKNKKIKGISILCLALIISSSVFSSVNVYKNEVYSHPSKNETQLLNYISENSNIKYVCELSSLRKVAINYSNPLLIPKINDNIIPFVSWVVGSPYYHSTLEINGIKKLFSEMINNSNIKLVLNDYKLIKMYEQYYNEQYSDENNILIIEEEKIDSFYILQIIKK